MWSSFTGESWWSTDLRFALALADWVYVMSKGRIVHESVPQELWKNQEVKSRYLGF